MMRCLRYVSGAGMILAMAVAGAAEDAVERCVACHGQAGTSQHESVPVIGGMSSFYLEYALETYQKDGRSCPESRPPGGKAMTMCEVAKALDKAEVRKVAAHYAAHKFVPPTQRTDPALVKAGQVLHERHCAKCHSDSGGNPDDDAGILAGQWKAYLTFTMEDFRSGKRPTLKKMQEKLDALKPADVEALAHYYASQG